MSSVFEAARFYTSIGISVIPIRIDGSKAPAIEKWKDYQTRIPTTAEIGVWFSGNPVGIACIGGKVSGNLEALDFDVPGLFDTFYQEASQNLKALIDSLPLQMTPSGGNHLIYRCSGPVSGNLKLARNNDEKTMIETKGEGGYFIVYPSPPECHRLKKPYKFTRWNNNNPLHCISQEERDALLNHARWYNTYIHPSYIYTPSVLPHEGNRPGDDYNKHGSWSDLLIKHGWKELYPGRWQRPGKAGPGISATLGKVGEGIFYVFSSNAFPFESERGYTLFTAYAHLEHGSNYQEAARQLSKEGYGTQLTTPLLQPQQAAPQMIPAENLLSFRLKPGQLDVNDEWAIPRFLLPNTLTLMFGKPSSGKSYLALTIALYLQHKGLIDSIIYMDGDNSKIALRKRGLDTLVSSIPDFIYIPAFNIPQKRIIDGETAILAHLRKHLEDNRSKRHFIVIDSIRNFMPGKDVNSDKDTGEFMQAARAFRDIGPNTIFLLHHLNKGGTVKNSTTFLDYCDTAFKIEQEGESKEEGCIKILLSKEKDRNGDILPRLTAYVGYKEYRLLILNDHSKGGHFRAIQTIVSILEERLVLTQNQLITAVRERIDIGEHELRDVLKEYSGKQWRVEPGDRNAILYKILEREGERERERKREGEREEGSLNLPLCDWYLNKNSYTPVKLPNSGQMGICKEKTASSSSKSINPRKSDL